MTLLTLHQIHKNPGISKEFDDHQYQKTEIINQSCVLSHALAPAKTFEAADIKWISPLMTITESLYACFKRCHRVILTFWPKHRRRQVGSISELFEDCDAGTQGRAAAAAGVILGGGLTFTFFTLDSSWFFKQTCPFSHAHISGVTAYGKGLAEHSITYTHW